MFVIFSTWFLVHCEDEDDKSKYCVATLIDDALSLSFVNGPLFYCSDLSLANGPKLFYCSDLSLVNGPVCFTVLVSHWSMALVCFIVLISHWSMTLVCFTVLNSHWSMARDDWIAELVRIVTQYVYFMSPQCTNFCWMSLQFNSDKFILCFASFLQLH